MSQYNEAVDIEKVEILSSTVDVVVRSYRLSLESQ